MNEMIHDVLIQTLPMITIACVILITMRLYDIFVNKKKLIFYKEFMILSFIIYCMALFETVTFQDVTWSTSNFIPFKEILRYKMFSNLFIKNVIGNVFLFVPFGFFISYFLNITKQKVVFIMAIITSICIEVTQLMIGRVFDIDDIILNVSGAMLGFYIYLLFNHIANKFDIFKARWFNNLLALIALITMLIGGYICLI